MKGTKPVKDLRADPAVRVLMDKAAQGDETAWVELARQLPADWWEHFPSLGRQAAQTWLAMAAGKDLVLRQSLEAQWQALLDELGQTTDSSVERLLVERVAACWLQVHYADANYASLQGKELPLAVLKAAEQRMDRAHRRYLAALRQLTTLRRLLPQPPQVTNDELQSATRTTRRSKPARKGRSRKAKTLPHVLTARLRGLMEAIN